MHSLLFRSTTDRDDAAPTRSDPDIEGIELMLTPSAPSKDAMDLVIDFWRRTVHRLSVCDRATMGGDLFRGMSREDTACRALLESHCATSEQLDLWGLRFLDATGWMLRRAGSMDLDASLKAMGAEDRARGVTMAYYRVLVEHLHSELTARFPTKYTKGTRAAMYEVIWSFAMRM